jgi:putative ABC transport system permease protein
MSAASEVADSGSRASSLALRYALRELRGGLRGFYVFIACIALGVMAIAGVGSVAASLSEGLAREGRTLLGGDVAFSLIQREAKPDEIAFLRARGEVSVAAALRVMARSADGRLALVELKAVDGNYPMLGELTLDPKMPVADVLAERDGTFGSAALSAPSRTSSPAMSASARAFWSAKPACARPDCCSPAAWCAGFTG